MCMHHIVICSLPGSTIFFHIISYTAWLKKKCWTQNVCFDFLYNFCLKDFSFQEEMSEIWSKRYIGLHVKYPLFCLILMKLEFSWQKIKNAQTSTFMNIRTAGAQLFHVDRQPDGWTDMMMLTVTFKYFVNVPKNYYMAVAGKIMSAKKNWNKQKTLSF